MVGLLPVEKYNNGMNTDVKMLAHFYAGYASRYF